jgi:CheB methylesterase
METPLGGEDAGGGFFHLRPHPGRDVEARPIEYRADVRSGTGQPGGFLSVAAGPPARRRRHGRAVRAIGIILSGYDGDGTAGCQHIKAKGGTTFAQDMSAIVDGMPLTAQASGCIDFVLPPDKIAEELANIGARVAQD